jgi:hypothetical protein
MRQETMNTDVKLFTEHLLQVRKDAESSLKRAASDIKKYYDQKHQEESFKLGELVFIDLHRYFNDRPNQKLDYRRMGPYRITKVLSEVAYHIALLADLSHVHPMFHISKLR